MDGDERPGTVWMFEGLARTFVPPGRITVWQRRTYEQYRELPREFYMRYRLQMMQLALEQIAEDDTCDYLAIASMALVESKRAKDGRKGRDVV